ncbi:MerR family DNA-binding transcriptional regulator [Methylacidiphilum sp. Yel]|jgi:DNA-binding transcriptional MerR regulator|uniref:MerR family DNA-binding transcriptional regulator n=1 Tax=Methylacidiphilum sp. Yel TaxID=1847730 RepID=UPI001ABD3EBE
MYILNLLPKLVSIQEAAEFFGVAPQTLRLWKREDNLLPDEPTAGGRRRYDLVQLRLDQFHAPEKVGRTIAAYARVSSHD